MRTTKALALRRRGRTDKGDIVVDLGTQNGMVVVVSPDGWELMPTSPVLFRRTELSAPLPIPVRSAPSTDLLFEHLNVSECHGLLVVGWIVSAFVPDIAHAHPGPVRRAGHREDDDHRRRLVSLVDPSVGPGSSGSP